MTQATATAFKSPLHKMTQTTPTCLWNDSASIQELTYSMEHGGVGATCNPVIVLGVLKSELAIWKSRIEALLKEFPTADEDEIAWKVVREISVRAAAVLKPVFDAQGGKNGRLSIQTDPRLYRDAKAIVAQAEEFSRLAPNMIVKIPVTSAGIPAIEEATYRGISINATVCFTLTQCVAVAVAVFKKTYKLFRERGYRIRLLAAAFRNHMHWSELIGGDIVVSPPYAWQVRLNKSDIEVVPRIDRPVAPEIVEELGRKFVDFQRAYTEKGISIAEFDSFGPTRRTLRQFVAACHDLDGVVRDIMLANPDVG